MDIESIRQEFVKRFGRAAGGLVRAPGRVNLIGEHTDYNDGFVLPIAIERQTVAAWANRDDGRCCFVSAQQAEAVEIDLCEPICPGEPAWGNYCKGVVAGLLEQGLQLGGGVDVYFESDVPLNAGLSSSASLEVATAITMLAACEQTLPPAQLAALCQKAENVFAGAPCGIMDQSISIMGKARCALLLDCRSLETKDIPFDFPQATLLVCDTQVSHDIGDGGYPARRRQCEAAAEILGVKALRDTDLAAVQKAHEEGKLDEVQFRRARHIVTEIARTLQAAKVLASVNVNEAKIILKNFGELMYASHESLRDDFEVSCEELDVIVELSRKCEGVFGARMTGGGFGGCGIVLCQTEMAEEVKANIVAEFTAKFDRPCPVFATSPADGAGVVN